MAVLIAAVVPGQTQAGYDEAMKILRPLLHENVTPKRTYLALHSLGLAAAGTNRV